MHAITPQERTEIKVVLESTRVMRREKIVVRFKLMNEGVRKAENIIVSILPSRNFMILGSSRRSLKILDPDDFDKMEFCIKVKNRKNSVRVTLIVEFDSADKTRRELSFTDKITFFELKREYIEIRNPYIPGIPIRTPRMFYGRDELLKDIETTLKMKDKKHILIIYGQRRIGKTSIFYQLRMRLENTFVPVFLDFQGLPDEGTSGFFHWMAFEICRELTRRGIEFPIPDKNSFLQKPVSYFTDSFLQKVEQKLMHHRLVLMIDEFEGIDYMIRTGRFDRDILVFVESLLQHSDHIDLILSIGHRPEEMDPYYNSVFMNICLHYEVGFLSSNEATDLICEPVKEYIEYDPLAIEKILDMTAGHPYFIQLVCYFLINHQIEEKRNYVTIEDVNGIVDTVLVAGTPHFEYIWSGIMQLERIILLALANISSLQNVSSASDIAKYLRQCLFEITEQDISRTLRKILDRDIIEQKSADYYRFKDRLFEAWVRKNKEIQKAMEES